MISKYSRRIVSVIAAVVILLVTGVVFAAILDNTGVAIGATQSITGPTASGGTLCKKVTNNSPTGKQVYVPGSTAAEWQSFVANPPTDVVVASCAGPCTGVMVGGFCWYLGASGGSCDATCATHGGSDMNGTNGYAGAGGTNAQCQAVINALDTPYTYAVSDTNPPGSTPSGCGKVNITGGERRRYLGNPTTGSATLSSFRRACACNFTCGGSYTISSNQVNLNLFSYAGSPSCTNGSYTFTINPGVIVYSNNTATPALTTGTWPSGTTITLVNNGTISGGGGGPGYGGQVSNDAPGSGGAGGNGGNALHTTLSITIRNNGTIAGGGGGGGGGASGGLNFSGGNGGFGASVFTTGSGTGARGNDGQLTVGGAGGAPGVVGSYGEGDPEGGAYGSGAGGGGGGYGASGGGGGSGYTNSVSGGTGGAAGKAVNANGNTITWLATGTRYGAIQ